MSSFSTYPQMLGNEKAPPPAYQDVAAQPTNVSSQDAKSVPQNVAPSSYPPPQQRSFRFPQAFGIYHASGSFSDMLVAQQKDDPNPLYYVSTHKGFSSQPSVVLHSSRSPSSPPLATADFHSFSSTIDISLHVAIPPGSRPQLSTMGSQSAFSTSRVFRAPVPSTGKIEMFEWKRSQGPEVQSLHGRSHGKKCVRLATGEVVAAWTHPDMSMNKKGKVAFMGDRAVLGEGFEVMCVMTILAIMEKERRAKNSSAAGGAGAGAGAGAGC